MTDPEKLFQQAELAENNGYPDQAVALYEQLITSNPKNDKAHGAIARTLLKSDTKRSFTHAQKALRLNPKSPAYHLLMAYVLVEQKQTEKAIKQLRASIRIFPDSVEIRSELTSRLHIMGDLKEAIQHAEILHETLPNHELFLYKLCTLYHFNCEPEKAVENYRKLIELCPNNPQYHFNLGLILLSLKRWKEAWPHYSWRHKMSVPHFQKFQNNYKTWQGEALAGKTILLSWEQGLGDTIQYARYASALNAIGAEVFFDLQPVAYELISSLPQDSKNPIHFHKTNEPQPAADFFISIMDIPLVCSKAGLAIPNIATPYLKAPKDLIVFFKNKLSALTGLKVGLCWQGNPNYPRDGARSFPLSLFEPIADMPNVDLVSLQVIDGIDQIDSFKGTILNLEREILDGEGGLARLAALIENLDLVITCDTAIAHLAGALNKPVWVLLPKVADWRWGWTGTSTHYYPSMSLFRQSNSNEWAPVFESLLKKLNFLTAHNGR